jgi:hypothetical protein
MTLKYVHPNQMTDLQSAVACVRKKRWSELAPGHEINCVLGENPISYSTVGKDVRMSACPSRKPDAPTVEQSEGDFSLDDRIARVLSEEPFPSVRKSVGQISSDTLLRVFHEGIARCECVLTSDGDDFEQDTTSRHLF